MADIIDLEAARAVLRPAVSSPEEWRKAERDPEAHKLTTLMANNESLTYRWWGLYASPNRTGSGIAFCWSGSRNVAGYFLGWRETWGPSGVKRDMWTARRVRRDLATLQEKRKNALLAKGWRRTSIAAISRKRNEAKRDTERKARGAVNTATRRLLDHVKGENFIGSQAGATFNFTDRYGRRFVVSVRLIGGPK